MLIRINILQSIKTYLLYELHSVMYCFLIFHFRSQTDVVEKYIENHLKRNMKDFSMDVFTSQLQ